MQCVELSAPGDATPLYDLAHPVAGDEEGVGVSERLLADGVHMEAGWCCLVQLDPVYPYFKDTAGATNGEDEGFVARADANSKAGALPKLKLGIEDGAAAAALLLVCFDNAAAVAFSLDDKERVFHQWGD